MTPAEFTSHAMRLLDAWAACEVQRNRATTVSLLLFAGRLDEALPALADLATSAESPGERQAWLELGEEVVRALEADASRRPRSGQP